MTIAVTEYTDPAKMLADYAARRARMYGGPSAPVAHHLVNPPPKEQRAPEPPPPADDEPWEPKTSRHFKPWSRREVDCLRTMAADGVVVTNIARHMRRSRDAIISKAREIGVVIPLRGQISVSDMGPADEANRARLKRIVRIVADVYACPVDDIMGHSRNADIIEARHHAMWLCAKETSLSYPQLARAFRRDHTTILHAVRRVNAIKGENVRNAGLPR